PRQGVRPIGGTDPFDESCAPWRPPSSQNTREGKGCIETFETPEPATRRVVGAPHIPVPTATTVWRWRCRCPPRLRLPLHPHRGEGQAGGASETIEATRQAFREGGAG